MKAEFIQTCITSTPLLRYYANKDPKQKCGIKIKKALCETGEYLYGDLISMKILNNYYVQTYRFKYKKELYAAVVHSGTDFLFKIN
jgi:hypothetical protein